MSKTISANGESHDPQPHIDENTLDTVAQTTEESSAQSRSSATSPRTLPDYFSTGNLAGTHNAVMALLEEVVARHRHGDWGDIDEGDKQQNILAIVYGNYVLSSYVLPHTGVRIWVVTEGDRSLTTVLLPEEYQNPRSWWTTET